MGDCFTGKMNPPTVSK